MVCNDGIVTDLVGGTAKSKAGKGTTFSHSPAWVSEEEGTKARNLECGTESMRELLETSSSILLERGRCWRGMSISSNNSHCQ